MEMYAWGRIGFPLSIIGAIMSWINWKTRHLVIDFVIFTMAIILMYILYQPRIPYDKEGI